jgi:hypothetical protein
MGKEQLALDRPFPATPAEREAAVLIAFGPTSGWRVVEMRAHRHRCPQCSAPVGEACRRLGRYRRRLAAPHPSRVALTVRCEPHGRAVGQRCGVGVSAVCEARMDAVGGLLARPELAPADPVGPMVDEEHDFSVAKAILDWAEAPGAPGTSA